MLREISTKGPLRKRRATQHRTPGDHRNYEQGIIENIAGHAAQDTKCRLRRLAVFSSIAGVECKRCAQTTAGVMEVVVGKLCFSGVSTGTTGTRLAEIWAPHCGALRISCEVRFSEAAVPSNNRRGQRNSVSEKQCLSNIEISP